MPAILPAMPAVMPAILPAMPAVRPAMPAVGLVVAVILPAGGGAYLTQTSGRHTGRGLILPHRPGVPHRLGGNFATQTGERRMKNQKTRFRNATQERMPHRRGTKVWHTAGVPHRPGGKFVL